MPSNPNGTGSPIDFSVDWATRVISVPQSYLTFVSGTLYAMDTDAFHYDLRELEASETGIPFIDTHSWSAAQTVAGTTFAPFFSVINGYTVVFEDGQYAVRLDATNNNIFDEGIIIRNQVSIIPTNSAGLQIVTQGSGLLPAEQDQLAEIHGNVQRAIYVDTTIGPGGDGKQQTPFNTVNEGITRARFEGLSQVHVTGTTGSIGGGVTDVSDIEFIGFSILGTSVQVGTFSPTGITSNKRTLFTNMELTGAVDSHVSMDQCIVQDFTAANFIANNCVLAGTLVLAQQPGSPNQSPGDLSQFVDCRDSNAGTPTIEFGGGEHSVNLSGYTGSITITNMEPGDVIDVGLNSGSVIIDASCTGGIINASGAGEIVDNSGNVTVNDDNLNDHGVSNPGGWM